MATTGAHQNNVGVEFAMVKFSVYQQREPPATITIAQQSRSPLYIRPSAHPPNELLHMKAGKEIRPNHFHGRNIYIARAATFIDENGGAVHTRMEVIGKQIQHNPDWLDTMIICLSVFMNTTDLSGVVTRAILLYTHGFIEARLKGDFGVMKSILVRHAAEVLSRDSMCDKLKIVKKAVRTAAKRAFPDVPWHDMLLPPRSGSEREDFVELLVRLMSAPKAETTIYTRSVKLLGLTHLLAHYGWQIGILVQQQHAMEPGWVAGEPGTLSVVYSLADSIDHVFIETHARQGQHGDFEAPNSHFYTTTLCKGGQWRANSAIFISTDERNEQLFLKGYEDVKKTWDRSVRLEVTILPQGQLFARIKTAFWNSRVEQAKSQHEYAAWWRERFSQQSKVHKVEAIVNLVSTIHPDFDWEYLSEASQECTSEYQSGFSPERCHVSVVLILQVILESLEKEEDLTRYTILGAILAILDEVINSLVSVPDDCLVRIPVGESVEFLIQQASDSLEALLDSDRGLQIGDAVLLCAARLAGVNPEDPKIAKATVREDIVGYRNGQQGILPTPVLKRSLLWDLPEGSRKPLTLHNRPVLGIPTDSGGWIKAGTPAQLPVDREIEKFTSIRPAAHIIILQYRAHFEEDPSELVAAVYINGVFYSLISLRQALGRFSAHHSYTLRTGCTHASSAQSSPPPQAKYVPLRNLDPGIRPVPRDDYDGHVIVGTHQNCTSRLFAYLLYEKKEPVIQHGCFGCASSFAKDNRSCVIIGG